MKDRVTETIDLLRGFDSRRLQQEMTTGLPDWHRRRKEEAHNRRLYAATTCVMLLLVLASFHLAPTLNYSAADGVNYGQVKSLAYNMLAG